MYLTTDSALSLLVSQLGDQFIYTKKIQAIKLVRALTNLGLMEAKNAVEAHNSSRSWLEDRKPVSTRANRLKAVRQMQQALNELESHVRLQADDFAPEPNYGATIMWTHVFPHGNGKVYTYVAIRDENGIWHITGDDDAYRWADMQQKFTALRNEETFRYLG